VATVERGRQPDILVLELAGRELHWAAICDRATGVHVGNSLPPCLLSWLAADLAWRK